MNELEQLRAENRQLRMSMWLAASRMNCLLLDAPPLPSPAEFANNSDYLRSCERSIDQHMQAVISAHPRRLNEAKWSLP